MTLKTCILSPLVALALVACQSSGKNPDAGDTDSATVAEEDTDTTEGPVPEEPTTEGDTDTTEGPVPEEPTTEEEPAPLVTIEESSAMCVADPTNLEPESNLEPGVPSLTAKALGDGKVEVTETEHEENCGYSLSPVVSVEPGTVTISYETSGEAADCVCAFTIETTLAGLTPGEWTIVSGELSTTVDVI